MLGVTPKVCRSDPTSPTPAASRLTCFRKIVELYAGSRLCMSRLVMSGPQELWEIHLRIPAEGPVAIASKRGGKSLVGEGVIRLATPFAALRQIEALLSEFGQGDQLFITARTHDTALSMWSTTSKAVGLYWCATALGQLWCARGEPPLIAAVAR